MAEQRVRNRWWVVVGAIILQLCLGVIYSWSVFVVPIEKFTKTPRTQTSIAFTLVVVFFALAMIFAGRAQDKLGPRKVAYFGSVLLGIAFLLTGFVTQIQNIWWVYLSYGVIGGIGIGSAYVTPVACCVKWFPDKRGMVVGLAVFGFGFSAFIFGMISPPLIAAYGLQTTFFILAVILWIAALVGSSFMRNPPPGWKPAGWTPPPKPAPTPGAVLKEDYAPSEIVKTVQFWSLLIMYAFTAGAGLLVISQASPWMTKEAFPKAPDAPLVAGFLVGWLAIFNGLGRIIVGSISDLLGRVRTMVLDFAVGAIAMFLLYVLGQSLQVVGAGIGLTLIGLFYGGILALMPSATADFFGTKNVGANYGLVFLGWGLAGVIGPVMAGMFYDATKTYQTSFYVAAVLVLIAAAMAAVTKAPAPRAVEAPAKA